MIGHGGRWYPDHPESKQLHRIGDLVLAYLPNVGVFRTFDHWEDQRWQRRMRCTGCGTFDWLAATADEVVLLVQEVPDPFCTECYGEAPAPGQPCDECFAHMRNNEWPGHASDVDIARAELARAEAIEAYEMGVPRAS